MWRSFDSRQGWRAEGRLNIILALFWTAFIAGSLLHMEASGDYDLLQLAHFTLSVQVLSYSNAAVEELSLTWTWIKTKLRNMVGRACWKPCYLFLHPCEAHKDMLHWNYSNNGHAEQVHLEYLFAWWPRRLPVDQFSFRRWVWFISRCYFMFSNKAVLLVILYKLIHLYKWL